MKLIMKKIEPVTWDLSSARGTARTCRCLIFIYLIAYLSSYHEKAINALYELAKELPAICLPHQDGGIPLSAFPNGTASKLAGLFSTLSLLMLSVKQGSCEYQF